MSGLILKDLFVVKKIGKIYLVMIFFYMAMDLINEGSSFFMTFLMVFICMFSITAMAYDERSHWNKYALSMPIDRKDIVLGKYLFGIICILFVLILSFLMIVVRIVVKQEVFSIEMVATALISASIGLLIIGLTMPIMFALGTEKGRIFLMLIFVVVFLIPVVLNQLHIELDMNSLDIGNEIMWIIPLVGIAVYALSIVVSVFIYKKKEVLL